MQTLQTKWKKSKKVSISGGHIFLSTLVNSFCQMTENFGFPEYTHSWSPLSLVLSSSFTLSQSKYSRIASESFFVWIESFKRVLPRVKPLWRKSCPRLRTRALLKQVLICCFCHALPNCLTRQEVSLPPTQPASQPACLPACLLRVEGCMKGNEEAFLSLQRHATLPFMIIPRRVQEANPSNN